MEYLANSDVRITVDVPAGRLVITTSSAAYQQARSVLLGLRDSAGLDVDLMSEERAIFESAKELAGGQSLFSIISEDGMPPRTDDNQFVVMGAGSFNLRGEDEYNSLADELAGKFIAKGLTVKVFPSSIRLKRDQI